MADESRPLTHAELAARIIPHYETHAAAWEHDRTAGAESDGPLLEQAWLDRFLRFVPRGGQILDLGCGFGYLATYLITEGRRVTGVDSSPSLIARARGRHPDMTWIVGDMRTVDLRQPDPAPRDGHPLRFDGLLAWDSFFHLTADDQRAMFPRFAAHVRPGGMLLFTSGDAAGVAMGTYQGDPLYHASLAPDEYRALLEANRFAVWGFVAQDPECGRHTVWLARRR